MSHRRHIDRQITVPNRRRTGNTELSRSVAQIQSWSCSLGLVLAFLQDQDQEQDRVFLARPRPRLTVQDLSKNKT
ncbi:jg7117 [Pararge aegeria aegeria]|uniref:Jg7117 protein n=1 Tax=Pararge aegeria aegeria TaxID=348720 RepID=A0A8S4S0C5_9NEOP|nr:jg7117 [Pararge aegeria aegeria]